MIFIHCPPSTFSLARLAFSRGFDRSPIYSKHQTAFDKPKWPYGQDLSKKFGLGKEAILSFRIICKIGKVDRRNIGVSGQVKKTSDHIFSKSEAIFLGETI